MFAFTACLDWLDFTAHGDFIGQKERHEVNVTMLKKINKKRCTRACLCMTCVKVSFKSIVIRSFL